MDGVDDHRNPRGAGGKPAVDARFRIVGVDDRGPEICEDAAELAERRDVAMRSHRPRRVPQRYVLDAPRLELLDIRSRCRYADRLVAGALERLELRSEQQRQADVRGGDVQEASHTQAQRYSTWSAAGTTRRVSRT